MRWTILGAVVAAVLTGCGGESIKPGGGPPTQGCTEDCAASTLWPMTTASSWTYKITDPARVPSVFEKVVTVEGEREIPEEGGTATLLKSVQPHLEEHSYQIVVDGLVKRVREEDYKAGALARVATWNPDTLKALSVAQPQGWTDRSTIYETVVDLVAGTTEEKEKLFVWTVVAVDVPIQVGGTEYKAIKVLRDREDKDGAQRTYWFVPGIGKVREEGERTEELIRFDVK